MMHAMSEHAGVGVLPFDGMGLYEQPRPPRLVFKMPRVVPDQKSKFESDELFRRLSRESEFLEPYPCLCKICEPPPNPVDFKLLRVVLNQRYTFENDDFFKYLRRKSQVRYTGYRDRPQEERQVRFQNGCREGHTEIAFAATGTNLQLVFGNASGNYAVDPCDCDFDKEHGKVHLRSHLIMNGVCVRWRGWIDLDRLDGVGCLEYDEERAAEEDALLRDQLERYNQRLREFEEKQRAYRTGAAAAAQPPHLNHHYHHDTHHAASHHHHHHGHHSRHVGGAGATGATATGIEPHLPHRQDPEMEMRDLHAALRQDEDP